MRKSWRRKSSSEIDVGDVRQTNSSPAIGTPATRVRRGSAASPPRDAKGSLRGTMNLNTQKAALATIIQQAETLLRYKSTWDDAIRSGDTAKIQAFTDKAAKLLLVQTALLKRSMRRRQLTPADAVVMCQSMIRANLAQIKYKAIKRRANVAREIVTTERSYMRALGIALVLHRKELTKLNLLEEKQIEQLFNNIQKLRELNMKFWRELELIHERWNVDSCVGETFLTNLQSVITEYIIYVQGYEAAIGLHESLLQTNKGYVSFNNKMQQDAKTGGLRLEAYLILPVQRFPRYLLLLQELFNTTPVQHPDRANLMLALKKVKEMTSKINEETRSSHGYRKLAELESILDSGKDGIKLTDRPTRKIVAEVKCKEVIKGKASARTLFVFDDMMMCVKKGKSGKYYVQWTVAGSQLVLQPQSTTDFILTEYKRTEVYPFTESVDHRVHCSSSEHSTKWWADTAARIRAVVSKPVLADTQRWLQNHLVTEREWEMLRAAGQEQEYSAQQLVCSQTRPNRYLYIVKQGSLGQFCRANGALLPVLKKEASQFLGHLSYLVGSEPHDVHCGPRASTVHVVSHDRLTEILVADPHLGHRFFFLLCVTICENFFSFPLMGVLEKQYMEIAGSTDPAPRDTLANIFQSSKSVSLTPNRNSAVNTANLDRAEREAEERKVCEQLKVPRSLILQQSEATYHKGALHYRGHVYVLRTCLGFLAKILGRVTTVVIPFVLIDDVTVDGSRLSITRTQLGRKVTFSFTINGADGFGNTIIGYWNKSKRANEAKLNSGDEGTGDVGVWNARASAQQQDGKSSGLELSDADWDGILERATIRTFKNQEAIITEGDVQQTLYQVMKGSCRVESEVEELVDGSVRRQRVVLTELTQGAIFGEKSYLFGGSAVEGNSLELMSLERAVLDNMFSTDPGLAAKFYKHLAKNLTVRTVKRDQKCISNFNHQIRIHRGSADTLTELLSPRTARNSFARSRAQGSYGELRKPGASTLRGSLSDKYDL